jgi:hypothetical protein
MSLTPTGQRQLSNSLAASDPMRAIAVARAIEDPWFRCQALAHVARYWPGEDFEPILREASKAAESQDNRYKRVTVSAWPIRAYPERRSEPAARSLLERYAREASNIENMGGRSEALLMLFQAGKPFDPRLWEPVFWALVQASEPALAWRQLRNIRYAAAMIATENPSLVQEAISRLSNEKTVTALKRDLENGKSAEPRPFFWLD